MIVQICFSRTCMFNSILIGYYSSQTPFMITEIMKQVMVMSYNSYLETLTLL